MCSNPGACAATAERVQQRRSMCSNPGACAAIRSVCSKFGACAASWERVQQSYSCSEHRAEKSIKSGYRTLGVVGGVARGGRADLI